MDLIPTPEQVVSAASNVAHRLLYGGVADLRPMPRTLIDEGPLRELYHYRPAPDVESSGDPVLLVTPLAAPSICFDLRRGCSLVEHLVGTGRPTYLVEYGRVSFSDRTMGMEHWVRHVLPAAVRAASEHAGGRPVHLVGWSLGGIFTLLTAADSPDLPIASISAVGSPFDVAKVPLVAPVRPLLLNLDEGRGLVTRAYRALGGAPTPLVRWAFQLSSFQKLVTKPLALAVNLDDTEFLAQIEAVDRFTAQMTAYPGRTFGQLYHRFVKQNDLVDGRLEVQGRDVDVARVVAPVLVLAGNTDAIAPIAAVRPLVDLLTGAEEVRFEIVPGGHLGMLTGRAARTSTWLTLDEWMREWDGRRPAPRVLGSDRSRRNRSSSSRALSGSGASRSRGSGRAGVGRVASGATGATAGAPAKRASAPKASAKTSAKASSRKSTASKATAKKGTATASTAKKSTAKTSTAKRASATKATKASTRKPSA